MSRIKKPGTGSESPGADAILNSPEMKKLTQMTKEVLTVSKDELEKRIKEDAESRRKT